MGALPIRSPAIDVRMPSVAGAKGGFAFRAMRRRVFFHRDFLNFAGGHLKVWNYYCHTNAMPGFRAQVYLTEASRRDDSNPWRGTEGQLAAWRPEQADVLFVAGLDWNVVPKALPTRIPIINLVQGLGHADPGDPRYAFLDRPAIRICVSDEVRDALLETGRVRGPVFSIPNGIEIPAGVLIRSVRSTHVFIGGLKNATLAREIAADLWQQGIEAAVLTREVPRLEYLSALADAGIAVVLPHGREGFYLPALEAMAVGALAICPDCVGNRSFCLPGDNCYRPAYARDDIVKSVVHALSLTVPERERLIANARATAAAHTLAAEHATYHAKVLRRLDDLWRVAQAA